MLLTLLSAPLFAAEDKGPNGGVMLVQDGFAIELAIVERNQPPAYHAWASMDGKPLAATDVVLQVNLDRLGPDQAISFLPNGDFLQGDQVIFEPHSFVVNVEARYQGKRYSWRFDSIEGRSDISTEMAEALNIETEKAGPATLRETERVYGRLALRPGSSVNLRARFDGVIQTVPVNIGDRVTKGQVLARIESNESLKSYALRSPIEGVVVSRVANSGEQTAGRALFTVADDRALIAELNVFPSLLPRIKPGAVVSLLIQGRDAPIAGVIEQIDALAGSNQATVTRVALNEIPDSLRAGLLLEADVTIAEYDVPLAVRRDAVQAFRDFQVVYAKFAEQYEVRMLEMGRVTSDWVEVLGGLPPGTEYVVKNSYVIKADIEKSGAAHDH